MKLHIKMLFISLPIIFILLTVGSFFIGSVKNLKKEAPEKISVRLPRNPYQDIIINNTIVKRGRGPSCESRYAAIKKVIAQFNRPITVLDIGAAEGYMSLRIAHDFDATCVMVEHQSGESGGFLKHLCELNTDLDNIILLYKIISADELKMMSKYEHFDVVIALNVLHHFPKDKVKTAAKAIMALGDYVIVETPPINDTGSCGKPTLPWVIDFIEKNNGKIIAKTSRKHTRPDTFANMYFLKGTNRWLKRRGFFELNSPGYAVCKEKDGRFLIRKTDLENYIRTPQDKYKIDYPKGINFLTFKLFNGVYPHKETLKTSIDAIKKDGLSIMPQDLVMQGNNIISIAKDNSQCDDNLLNQVFDIADTLDVNKVVLLMKDISERCSA